MPVSALLRSGLWLLVVYAVLTVTTLLAANWYAKAVIPLYRWELGWMAPNYEIQTIELDRSGAEPQFTVVARDRDFVFAGGQLRTGATLHCQILVMEGLQHFVIVLLVPLAWPGLVWRTRIIGLAFAFLILIILECVDIPLAIIGAFDFETTVSSKGFDSLPKIWAEISSGGRLALGLAGGLIACGAARVIDKKTAGTRKFPPH